MAVITTTFSSTSGAAWASSTWASGDPSWKLDVQLTNWVNAINDASKISIIATPGSATARGSGDLVQWLLRCRESDTSSDYGLNFCGANASGSAMPYNPCGAYYGRTAGSANNGYGNYGGLITMSAGATPISTSDRAADYRTAYDAEGATPWFAFMSNMFSGSNSGTLHFLCRLSLSNMASGSYYPSSGLGKWIYATVGNTSYTTVALPQFVTPQRNILAPYIGVGSYRTLRAPQPPDGRGDGYFFKLGAQYGDSHFLGEPTYDMLVSSGQTGTWGDTVILESKTYTRAVGCLWVRIA